MRKLLVVFLAVSLFAACKNEKKDSRTDKRTESDDYRNKEDDKDTKSTDYKDDEKSSRDDDRSARDEENTSSDWSSDQVSIFVDNCANEAVKGGMQRSKATEYCECMQRKLEVMYPDPQDVGNIDTETPEMKAMIRKCLGM